MYPTQMMAHRGVGARAGAGILRRRYAAHYYIGHFEPMASPATRGSHIGYVPMPLRGVLSATRCPNVAQLISRIAAQEWGLRCYAAKV